MALLESAHDVVVYYVFWSLFYALAPMIWFYPLNELDITGYEAFAVVWLIPVVTAIAPLRWLLQTQWGLRFTKTGMAVGILSFHAVGERSID